MCLHVAMEIRELGGKFRISTLDEIGLWIDSKINENLGSNVK